MTERILTVAEWITATNGFHLKDEAREIARLGDGGWLSIQASRYHRCDPKVDNAKRYRTIEIGSQGVLDGAPEAAELLAPYKEQSNRAMLYASVPLEIADRYVTARGGIVI